jgi:hypothetical protein
MDIKTILAQVLQKERAFYKAPEELRGDKEFVLAVVRNYGKALQYASKELRGDREVVLAAVQQDGFALEYASKELRGDREVVLAAVQQDGFALEYASKELKEDKKFLIECYRKNNDIRKYNDFIEEFIEEFDKLEKQEYDNIIIKNNIDILHLVKNKEQLCEYLYQNIKYDIIYHNEKIAEYIKNKYKIIIFSCNDINIKKDHGNDELRENFIQKNPNYNVRFID